MDRYTKAVLTAIAVLLFVVAFRSTNAVPAAMAQMPSAAAAKPAMPTGYIIKHYGAGEDGKFNTEMLAHGYIFIGQTTLGQVFAKY